MRRSVWLILAVTLALSGCAGRSLDPGNLDEIKIAAQEDKGEVQKMADEILGITSTPEARVVRLCMIEATIVEVMTYRVTKFDVDYAPTAYGQIATLQGILAGLDAASMFPDTDMALAALQIDRILIEVGQDRVPRLLANLTGGINILGVVDRARIVAAQSKIIAAMVRDTRAMIGRIENENGDVTAALVACKARIDRNAGRVLAMLSGGAAAPPQ